jgi:4-aminobutyrate aminotransferase-like enzyme
MTAIEFVKDRRTMQPDPEIASAVTQVAREKALILATAGLWSQCVTLLPPLALDDELVDEAAGIVLEAVEAATGSAPQMVAV